MYRNIFQSLLAIPFFLTAWLGADDCAICDEHLKHTNNTLFPVVQLVMTPCRLTDNFGLSLLGEIGSKNYRINGTLGGGLGGLGFLSSDHWFKFSGEYLSQKLQYSFYSGRQHRWVNQYAIGGTYQYLLPVCLDWSSWMSSIDVNLTYSHAFSRHIRSIVCPAESDSQLINTLNRNIAGGNNTHLNLGSTLLPWKCAHLFLGVDYDYTSYHRKYQGNVRSSGIGGTVALHQMLSQNWVLNLEAQFRRPFNYYAADINWTTPFSNGTLNFGLYANYTHGRDQLPNVTTIGISIDIGFGGGPLFVCTGECGSGAFRDCLPPSCDPYEYSCDSSLLAWIIRPAVFMPTVLAIADQSIVVTNPASPPGPPPPPPCTPPTSTAFPASSPELPLELPFSAGGYFDGDNIVYSLAQSPGGVIEIDPSSGELVATGPLEIPLQLTVVGTNSCGSSQQTGYFFEQF